MSTIELKNIRFRTRPSDGKAYFTIHDLETLPEYPEGPMLELIKGDIFVVPSPNTKHQEISLELAVQIKTFIDNKSLGRLFTSPYDVYFSDEDLAIPDLVYIKKENNSIIKEKNIEGTPNFIIEIVSSNRHHDFVDKKEMYENFGVGEYWIIDPEERNILVYLNTTEKKFKNPLEFSFGNEIAVTSIPNLKLCIE